MPSLEVIQTIISGGTSFILAIGIWGYATGRVRVGTLVDKREAKLTEERDAWKELALDSTSEIKRLGDLLEQAVDLLGSRRSSR